MKKAFSLLLALLLTAALAACGGKNEPQNTNNGESKDTGKTVDVAALAAELAEKVKFESGEMKDLSDKMDLVFDLPEGTQGAYYRGDGETKEEIITARCASEKDAAALKSMLETQVADLLADAQRYQPDAVPRLENPVLIQKGVYVALCITDDADTAEQIIKGYLG